MDRLPQITHRPIPKKIGYPSAFGLSATAANLIRDYGKHGAINMLIEMAEYIDADKNPLDWITLRRVEREG